MVLGERGTRAWYVLLLVAAYGVAIALWPATRVEPWALLVLATLPLAVPLLRSVPTGSVLANAPRHGRLSQIIEAKRFWDVSAANLTYRMHKVGLLTDWEYRTLFIEISRHGYRKCEPNPARGENSQVLTKVFGSLRDDGVTMSQVAKKLKIYPDELSRAVFGLALTPIFGGARPDSRPHPKPQLRVV